MRFEIIFFHFFVMTSFRHHDMTNKKNAKKYLLQRFFLHISKKSSTFAG